VEVVKKEREQVIIKAGLNAGERVLVSGLSHPAEGIDSDTHQSLFHEIDYLVCQEIQLLPIS
jgi:hypothetical protein